VQDQVLNDVVAVHHSKTALVRISMVSRKNFLNLGKIICEFISYSNRSECFIAILIDYQGNVMLKTQL